MPDSGFIQDFRAARRAGVPLIAVTTSDPTSTLNNILELTKNEKLTMYNSPVISWDIIQGVRAWNSPGKEAIKSVFKKDDDPAMMTNPAEAFNRALQFPKNSLFFIFNGHRFIGVQDTSEAAVGQALWNLRDEYKSQTSTAIILCPGIQLPPELKEDFLV